MTLSQQEIDFLTLNIRKFFPKNSHTLLLFGSYSTGTARSTSDIDIAIKGNGPIDAAKWQTLISFFEDSTFVKKVDLVDFHRVSDDFQKIILQNGKPLDELSGNSNL